MGFLPLLYTDQTVTRGFSHLKSKRQESRILLWHPCAFSPHPSRPLCLLAGPASRQVTALLSIFARTSHVVAARISQDPSWAATWITALRFCWVLSERKWIFRKPSEKPCKKHRMCPAAEVLAQKNQGSLSRNQREHPGDRRGRGLLGAMPLPLLPGGARLAPTRRTAVVKTNRAFGFICCTRRIPSAVDVIVLPSANKISG